MRLHRNRLLAQQTIGGLAGDFQQIGIADTDEMKARAMRIMQGAEQPAPGEPFQLRVRVALGTRR